MKTIAIDIGHGKDTYERTGGKGVKRGDIVYEEHDFNAKVGVELDKLLNANGFETIFGQQPFTKEVSLKERTDLYNQKQVDLVWSIHANAGTKDAKGLCAFYWYTADEAKRLANIFANEVRKAGYPTHGDGTHASKPNTWTNLHICRETKMTAVLTENGFMTNDEEFREIFKSPSDIQDIAQIHARSICKFYGVPFQIPNHLAPDKLNRASELITELYNLFQNKES